MSLLTFLFSSKKIRVIIKTSGRNERLKFEPNLKITPQENVDTEFNYLYNHFLIGSSGPGRLEVKYQGFYRGFVRN